MTIVATLWSVWSDRGCLTERLGRESAAVGDGDCGGNDVVGGAAGEVDRRRVRVAEGRAAVADRFSDRPLIDLPGPKTPLRRHWPALIEAAHGRAQLVEDAEALPGNDS